MIPLYTKKKNTKPLYERSSGKITTHNKSIALWRNNANEGLTRALLAALWISLWPERVIYMSVWVIYISRGFIVHCNLALIYSLIKPGCIEKFSLLEHKFFGEKCNLKNIYKFFWRWILSPPFLIPSKTLLTLIGALKDRFYCQIRVIGSTSCLLT